MNTSLYPFSLIMQRYLLALVLVLCAGTSTLQAQEKWHELQYPELKAFQKPPVTTFTLKNGIKVYLVEDNELPLINMNVLLRTGTLLEPADKTGLGTITGEVIRSGGSAKYPSDALNVMLEDKAAFMSTSIGFSSGSASLSTLKEDFRGLLPVFVDVIMNPSFPNDKIELSKRQLKTGISRRNDDAQAIASREFNELIYGSESVYARQAEYATIDKVTREDLVDFHRKSFVGANMMISIVGDFKTAEMRSLIEKQFAAIPRGKALELAFPEVTYNATSKVNLVDKKDSKQSVVFMGHEGGLRTDPDYAALQVMNEVLAGGFSGRLFQRVRTDLGLAYAVFGAYQSNLNYKGTFYTGVMTKPETTAEAIDAIKTEIKRLQNEPVSESELKRVKDQFLNSLVFRYTSRGAVLSERVSNEYNGLPADLFDTFIEQVKAVQPADIQRVAQTKVRPDEMQILVVSSKAAVGEQLQRYGAVNELDITIPQPKPVVKEAPKAEDPAAREWMNKMASALITPGTNFRGIKATGKISQGPMALDAVVTMIFPSEMSTLISAPMGQIQQNYKDGVAVLRIGEQEQNLGEEGARDIQSNLDSHYLNLALNKNRVSASFAGVESIDGVDCAKLMLNMGGGYTLWISSETNRPVRMMSKRYVPQMGGEVEVVSTFKDWKSVEGVYVSFNTSQTLNGNPGGGSSYTSVSLVR